MEITINNLVIGGNSADYYLESPVEGLESAPIRTSQDNYSGTDGGVVTGQFYSPRLITVSGFILDTCEDHAAARVALQDALPIRTDLEMVIKDFVGNEYVTTVRLLGINMAYENGRASRFKIDVVAGDPNLYAGDEIDAIISRFTGGGFILPVIFPAVFDAGSSPTVVNNTGNTEVYPTFTITGSATNPQFTNTDTGETVQVMANLGGSDVLIINMKERTITLNGGSVLYLRTDASSWWSLPVGTSRIQYETDSGSDTGVAVMSWRNAVLAI